MKTIRINYLDRRGGVIASHVTDDPFNPEQIAQWNAWMNDSAVEHPCAPEEWDQYELVAESWDDARWETR